MRIPSGEGCCSLCACAAARLSFSSPVLPPGLAGVSHERGAGHGGQRPGDPGHGWLRPHGPVLAGAQRHLHPDRPAPGLSSKCSGDHPRPQHDCCCRSRNLQCQRIFQVNAPINCVCLHPNQAELIVGDQSGAIHIWDLKTDHNEQLIPEPEVSVNSVHIDPDASYMAAVNSSGNCYVWNLTGGIGEEVTQLIPKTKIPAHNRYALQCKFSPDSTLLATCSADQTCKIWRTSNFSLMTELSIKSNNPGETSRGWMWDCAFSGDSQYIVTASSDNLARLWCVETGEIKREYSGHQKAVVCLAFNDSVLG
uniref:Target of rapamycin complex subunit lst8 n=1 Tax=Terrapene triunguis TaxID=2587831 RepID=A0A674IYV2_9SAUR